MSQVNRAGHRRPLHILTVVYSGLPVPPPRYGGIERAVAVQVNGLVQRGHRVTLMAARGSQVSCQLLTYSDRREQSKAWRAWAKLSFWTRLSTLLPHFDILSWHSRADYFVPALLCRRMPKIVSLHNPIGLPEVEWYHHHAGSSVAYVSLSDAQARHVRHIGRWATIPYGLALDTIQAVTKAPEPGYLVFLGRLNPYKGAHTAIAVARSTGYPLKIAGNIVHDPEGETYFKQEIVPHLVPGKIDYVGEVNDQQKQALLQGARALLFPIEWEEPFGLVLLEAMACGTPCIALNRGAVPEIITHGLDGFICQSVEEMVEAVQRITEIDRTACRRKVETAFSDDVFVDRYETLFYDMIAACQNGNAL